MRLVPLFRRVAPILCLVAAAGLASTPVRAQAWPDRPVTLVVGFPPGGALDTIARTLADEMGKTLGQKVIVDNKPGAGGNIAANVVLGAPADGYQVLLAAINLATAPAISGVKYDPRTDITMVSQVTSVPVMMLASSKSSLRSAADVVAAAKATPGGIKIGTGGVGTSGHLAAELLSRSLKIPYLHVPYKGGAAASAGLLGGEVDITFDLGSATLKGFVDAGQIRALAVMQDTRVPVLPEAKTAKEQGLPPDTWIRSWQGLAVRTGTPRPVIDKLHQAVLAAVDTPAFRARAANLGSEIVTSRTPEDFQRYYLEELERWTALIKSAGIKAE